MPLGDLGWTLVSVVGAATIGIFLYVAYRVGYETGWNDRARSVLHSQDQAERTRQALLELLRLQRETDQIVGELLQMYGVATIELHARLGNPGDPDDVGS